MTEEIAARFDGREQLCEAVFEMRRTGTMAHTGDIPAALRGRPELHMTVPTASASRARAIIRRVGGQIIF